MELIHILAVLAALLFIEPGVMAVPTMVGNSVAIETSPSATSKMPHVVVEHPGPLNTWIPPNDRDDYDDSDDYDDYDDSGYYDHADESDDFKRTYNGRANIEVPKKGPIVMDDCDCAALAKARDNLRNHACGCIYAEREVIAGRPCNCGHPRGKQPKGHRKPCTCGHRKIKSTATGPEVFVTPHSSLAPHRPSSLMPQVPGELNPRAARFSSSMYNLDVPTLTRVDVPTSGICAKPCNTGLSSQSEPCGCESPKTNDNPRIITATHTVIVTEAITTTEISTPAPPSTLQTRTHTSFQQIDNLNNWHTGDCGSQSIRGSTFTSTSMSCSSNSVLPALFPVPSIIDDMNDMLDMEKDLLEDMLDHVHGHPHHSDAAKVVPKIPPFHGPHLPTAVTKGDFPHTLPRFLSDGPPDGPLHSVDPDPPGLPPHIPPHTPVVMKGEFPHLPPHPHGPPHGPPHMPPSTSAVMKGQFPPTPPRGPLFGPPYMTPRISAVTKDEPLGAPDRPHHLPPDGPLRNPPEFPPPRPSRRPPIPWPKPPQHLEGEASTGYELHKVILPLTTTKITTRSEPHRVIWSTTTTNSKTG